MKSPGSGGKTTGSKGGKAGSKGKSGGKFPTKKALRREYKGEARREDASARREEADASHRRAEAEHYRQEAAKAEREGYRKEAEYDLAKARREQAGGPVARHGESPCRNQAKATARNRHKAAHVGLTAPGAVPDGWILGGNDWHQGCAAVALANHLYASTGLRVSDGDVLGLYRLTADDPAQGASIQATLEAAAEYGLGGMRPLGFRPVEVNERDAVQERRGAGLGADDRRELDALHFGQPDVLDGGPVALLDDHRHRGLLPARLSRLDADARDVGRGDPALVLVHPLIVDLRLQQAQRHQPVWDASPSPDWGAHAGVLAGDRVITWGREIPVTGDFLAQRVAGAWSVEWAA